MANICCIYLDLGFRTKKDKKAFRQAFQKKINDSEKRRERIRIARNKWLFDASIDDDPGPKSLAIYGSTKWCLEQESMLEWTRYLKRMKVQTFTCEYEEAGNLFYGNYTFEDGELWNSFVDEFHPVWKKANEGEDSYFEDLDHALETDGVMEQIA
jgi:hypothetical protein